jgi:hypothetical protein
MYENKFRAKPHPSVWKNYSNESEYMADLNSYIRIDRNAIPAACQIVRQNPPQELAGLLRSLTPMRNVGLAPPPQVNPSAQSPLLHPERAKLLATNVQKAFAFGMPAELVPLLMAENLLEEGQARGLVGEYLKFLVLCSVSASMCSPSAMVDEVWHLHQGLTGSYALLATLLFGRVLEHVP